MSRQRTAPKHGSAVPGLFLAMSSGVITMTIAISAFVAIGGWWLMGATLAALILATVGIVAGIGRALESGSTVETVALPTPAVTAAVTEAPAPQRRPAGAPRPVLGH